MNLGLAGFKKHQYLDLCPEMRKEVLLQLAPLLAFPVALGAIERRRPRRAVVRRGRDVRVRVGGSGGNGSGGSGWLVVLGFFFVIGAMGRAVVGAGLVPVVETEAVEE